MFLTRVFSLFSNFTSFSSTVDITSQPSEVHRGIFIIRSFAGFATVPILRFLRSLSLIPTIPACAPEREPLEPDCSTWHITGRAKRTILEREVGMMGCALVVGLVADMTVSQVSPVSYASITLHWP